MAEQDTGVEFKVPSFAGTESRVDTETWLQKTEAVVAARVRDAPDGATAAQLREVSKKKAQTFVMNFKGKAFSWFTRWKRDHPDDVNNYDLVYAAFKARYLKPQKRTNINEVMAELKQGAEETVEDFFDRCHGVACQFLNYDDTARQVREDPNFLEGRDRLLANAVVAGVKPQLR